jgi:hypothetical protein
MRQVQLKVRLHEFVPQSFFAIRIVGVDLRIVGDA